MNSPASALLYTKQLHFCWLKSKTQFNICCLCCVCLCSVCENTRVWVIKGNNFRDCATSMMRLIFPSVTDVASLIGHFRIYSADRIWGKFLIFECCPSFWAIMILTKRVFVIEVDSGTNDRAHEILPEPSFLNFQIFIDRFLCRFAF